MSDAKIEETLKKAFGEIDDSLLENAWYQENNYLIPGVYILTEDIADLNTGEIIADCNTKVIVENHLSPAGSIFDINIYKVKHIRTNKEIYITAREIKR